MVGLLDDTVPYYVNEARPIPFVDRMEVKQLLNDYVEQGLIASVEEASEWAAPPVVRPIQNRDQAGICPFALGRFLSSLSQP